MKLLALRATLIHCKPRFLFQVLNTPKDYFYCRTFENSNNMNTPDNLKYSKEHEWLSITGEKTDDGLDIALVGITDFAQGELGEIVYVEVDTVGEEVDIDEVFGTVEAVKTTSDLFMPVSGRVLEFNAELDENDGDNPGVINSDPYGGGWIAKIAITQPSEVEDLLTSDAYGELIG